LKITKGEVEELIALVERSMSREISFVGPRIQSAKKMNGYDAQKLAVRKLLDLLYELIADSVAEGSLSPRETVTAFLDIYKRRHRPRTTT